MSLEDTRKQDIEAEEVRKRKDFIEGHRIPKSALSRFLSSEGIQVSQDETSLPTKVARDLTEDQFQKLEEEYEFAGRTTIRFVVMKGISNKGFGDLTEKLEDGMPSKGDKEGSVKDPYFVSTTRMNDRLYVKCGYNIEVGTKNVESGYRDKEIAHDLATVVIRDDCDLVEIRESKTGVANKLKDRVARAIGLDPATSTVYKPDFGPDFMENFEEHLVKYLNLTVRIEDNDEREIEKFTATAAKRDDGGRKDARDAEKVKEEVEEKSGEITTGYLEVDEGDKFKLNKAESKITFRKYASENALNTISNLIHGVLRDSGEYSQRTIEEAQNVPE